MLEALSILDLRLMLVPLGSPNNYNQHFLSRDTLFTPRTVLLVWKPHINFSTSKITIICTPGVVIRDSDNYGDLSETGPSLVTWKDFPEG